MQLVDLTKQLADVNSRLRHFAAMYEVVKNERNAIANSIQAASQAIAEQVRVCFEWSMSCGCQAGVV